MIDLILLKFLIVSVSLVVYETCFTLSEQKVFNAVHKWAILNFKNSQGVVSFLLKSGWRYRIKKLILMWPRSELNLELARAYWRADRFLLRSLKRIPFLIYVLFFFILSWLFYIAVDRETLSILPVCLCFYFSFIYAIWYWWYIWFDSFNNKIIQNGLKYLLCLIFSFMLLVIFDFFKAL